MNSRRHFLKSMAVGFGGASISGWFPLFADQLANNTQRKRHCILLWMSGGPTQTDTFDMKPNHENGGEFSEIQTNAPGLKFSEHMPKLAGMADQLAVLRGLSTKEGDHGRGTYLMRTGKAPMGIMQYPSIGASLGKHLGQTDLMLPNFVSIGSFRSFNADAFGSGFLGPRFSPLFVGETDNPGSMTNDANGFPQLKVQSLECPQGITEDRMNRRLTMWKSLQSEFLETHRSGAPKAHNMIYDGAVQLMNSKDAKAFDLTEEPAEVREAYGATVFGQGCLLARRLIERGVSFVEVTLGGSGATWDTHSDNFNAVRNLSTTLDNGWANLMQELKDRDLLESTTILWMGEFGRTPQINGSVGRDHFPGAWSAVLAGGGIAGGQAYGKTSENGMEVVEGKIDAPDVLSTLCHALGVGDAASMAPIGRPIPIADGFPVDDVLA